jgi:hypothetical protein
MFKISHEVPLCLLEDSPKFNHYDYALVHLLDQDKDYANYFLKAKQQGRYIILDNSLHEIGESYHDSGLLYWINKLQPQEFLIPDVWQDTNASIRNARKWSQMQLPDGVEKVAVVQAENLTGASICYQTYKDLGYKKIAFSYGADYYKQLVNHPNPHIAQALGRVHVISNLYERKIIQFTDRVHLLGTACPFEFSLYKDMPFIETIDTSNPIMATLDGIRYNHLGIHDKPKANMNDHFYTDKIDYELLDYNIETFKKLII